MSEQVKDHPTWIVVKDPKDVFWQGSIVDSAMNRLLAARGVILLPCEPKLFYTGNGGFAYRAWGAGYPLDFNVPRMSCPLVMFCQRDFPELHWRARLALSADLEQRARAGEHFEGSVRLAADPGQAANCATFVSDTKPVQVSNLGEPDAEGGWIVGGRGRITVGVDGYHGFSLYGTAPGVRVVWAALSLARA